MPKVLFGFSTPTASLRGGEIGSWSAAMRTTNISFADWVGTGPHSGRERKSPNGSSLLRGLGDGYIDMTSTPPPSELVIGLVGAVGAELDLVATDIEIALNDYGYDAQEIRLSGLLADLDWDEELPTEPLDEHIWTHMEAGNRLRLCWERGDALALLALTEISAIREEKNQERYEDGSVKSLDRFAFILRSLKHPGEVELLRSIYGSRFVLVAAYAPEEIRKSALTEKLTKEYRSEDPQDWFKTVEKLMARDEAETEKAPRGSPYRSGAASDPVEATTDEEPASEKGPDADPPPGQEVEGNGMTPKTAEDEAAQDEADIPRRIWGQNLRDTFHRADLFVDAREGVGLKEAVGRIVEILFAHPFRTPNKDEYGLFAAEGAARQSAELGRQVGAAIATREGDVVALGSNEVPKAGGGVYWENGDGGTECGIDGSGDGREFRNPVDTNDRMKREIALEIIDQLEGEEFLKGDAGEAEAPELLAALERTRLGDLIEFGRAVHAEMAALMDAARRGASVRGCTLYTTTFPCHNCARHIVAAGIMRVVYVSPYSKSQAKELHGDAIDFAAAEPRDDAVQFEPFVGVAPRRYLDLFEAASRKHEDGKVVRHVPSEASLNIPDVELDDLQPEIPSYRQREALALDLLNEIFDTTDLRIR
jgi:cytidine deaminase